MYSFCLVVLLFVFSDFAVVCCHSLLACLLLFVFSAVHVHSLACFSFSFCLALVWFAHTYMLMYIHAHMHIGRAHRPATACGTRSSCVWFVVCLLAAVCLLPFAFYVRLISFLVYFLCFCSLLFFFPKGPRELRGS